MTEPTDDTLQAMMLAMLHAANNSEGYAAVQQYGIGPGGDAEMRAVFRVVQDALAAQGAARIDPMQDPTRPTLAKLGPSDEHPAEEALRKLACWLGVGGYNAPTVDADLFHRKIVAGIEDLRKNAAQPAPGWIACSERMPPQGEEVLVWLSEPAFKGGSHVVFDCWDEQHEAPVSFSSATIPVGPGWNSGVEWERITHWQPLPPPPAKDE